MLGSQRRRVPFGRRPCQGHVDYPKGRPYVQAALGLGSVGCRSSPTLEGLGGLGQPHGGYLVSSTQTGSVTSSLYGRYSPSGWPLAIDTCFEGTWTFLHRPTLHYTSSHKFDGTYAAWLLDLSAFFQPT